MQMDFTQYTLVSFTLRSYVSYLHSLGKLDIDMSQGRALWYAK